MSSPILQLADAVVAALNAQFVGQFVSTRQLIAEFTPDQLATTQVTVLPRSISTDIAARRATEDEYSIGVLVQRRIPPPNDPHPATLLDDLVILVQAIADFLRFKPMGGAAFMGIEIAPVFDAEALHTGRRFVSLIAVNYRRIRKVS
jgi:hypothetical protein